MPLLAGRLFAMHKRIERRVIGDLTPHPRNAALYGSCHGLYDDKLVESLLAGIWDGEIQVTVDDVIISGHRRCEHAIFADIVEANVWVRDDLPSDPLSPEVLSALLAGNLQRNKSNEQKLREFELWKEIESRLAKERQQEACASNSFSGGHLGHQGDKGKARDRAAQRVGLSSGSHAEKALKALKAADTAESSNDEALKAKAAKVKDKLERTSIQAAYRAAVAEGLLPGPKPRAKKPVQSAEASGTESVAQTPDLILSGAQDSDRARPSVPKTIKVDHDRERPYLINRWIPTAVALKEAHSLFKQERDRLRNAYGHPKTGVHVFTRPYQNMVEFWAEDTDLVKQLGEAIGDDSIQTVDDFFLRVETLALQLSRMADAVRMFTGHRPDNNEHSSLPEASIAIAAKADSAAN